GKWANDPLQPWFESLRNKLGLYCCARADGHPIDDGDWDMKGDSYRVRLQGEWIVVPGYAVISSPNKFGKAVVWFREGADIASGENTSYSGQSRTTWVTAIFGTPCAIRSFPRASMWR